MSKGYVYVPYAPCQIAHQPTSVGARLVSPAETQNVGTTKPLCRRSVSKGYVGGQCLRDLRDPRDLRDNKPLSPCGRGVWGEGLIREHLVSLSAQNDVTLGSMTAIILSQFKPAAALIHTVRAAACQMEGGIPPPPPYTYCIDTLCRNTGVLWGI